MIQLVALSSRSVVDGMRAIAGTASSGIGDLSERHDEYLYGSAGDDDRD